jgi:hypothetical protein
MDWFEVITLSLDYGTVNEVFEYSEGQFMG